MPSPSRVANAFLRLAYAEYQNLSDEKKAVVLGALVHTLRDRVNNRGTFISPRPKDVRFQVSPEGRIAVKDFPVPEVAWIEYVPDRRDVRVLNRGGSVLAKAPLHAPLDYTTVSQKNFGRAMGQVAVSLLSEIKANARGRTEQTQVEEESLRQKMRREKEEAEARSRAQNAERQKQLDKERADAERRQEWNKTHINGPELVAGLARERIKGTYQDTLTNKVIWIDGYQLSWGTVESTLAYFWFLSSGSMYGLLPTGTRTLEGRVPAMEKEKAIPLIAKGVEEALKRIEAAKQKKDDPEPEAEEVWSVARDGYMLEEAGEADEDHSQGYIAEVDTFTSKAKALAHAKDIAPAYLVRGTQMWNEPIGQVEEHDRQAWYQLIQAER